MLSILIGNSVGVGQSLLNNGRLLSALLLVMPEGVGVAVRS